MLKVGQKVRVRSDVVGEVYREIAPGFWAIRVPSEDVELDFIVDKEERIAPVENTELSRRDVLNVN
jgi:hypothetical protein